MARKLLVAITAALALLASACGGEDGASITEGADSESVSAPEADSDQSVEEPSAEESVEAEPEASEEEVEAPEESGGSGDGGTLTLGDELISLSDPFCFLEEQDVVGSEGKILFTAQASGTNAAGDDVLLDVTRFDEDSLFTGDDVIVDVGDIFSDDSVGWSANGEIGSVSVDGSTVSASDLTFTNFDDLVDLPGSFEIHC